MDVDAFEHPVERRQLGTIARERIANEYATQCMVSETEAVYEELLATLSPTRTVG